MSRFRNWCWTYNNYVNVEELEEKLKKVCNYFIYGYEVGKRRGTPHLQGYLELKNPKSLEGGMKKIHPTIYWDQRRGTQEEAIIYCKKGEDVVEWGTKASQGKRSDIDNVKQWVKEGKTMSYICENASSYQSMKTAEFMLKYQKPKAIVREVTWLYGPSGTEKTKQAFEELPDAAFVSMKNGFIIGYDGEEEVIIDDLRKDDIKYNELLRMLDRYPHTVNVKGGSRAWNAKRIFITSPHHPKTFSSREESKQILRRITTLKCTEVKGNISTLTSNDEEDFEI